MAVSAFYADFQFIFRTVCLHIVVSTAVICQPADHKGGGAGFPFLDHGKIAGFHFTTNRDWNSVEIQYTHGQISCGPLSFFLDGARSSFLREKIVGEGVPVLLYLAGHGGPWENCRVLFHHQPTWSDWPEGHGNLKG